MTGRTTTGSGGGDGGGGGDVGSIIIPNPSFIGQRRGGRLRRVGSFLRIFDSSSNVILEKIQRRPRRLRFIF